MTTEHIHNWNDTCDTRYTCPLQRRLQCVCGATRYVEIPDSGIPVVKLSDDECRMIETYHSLLNNELKQFDESKQYLEFKCSNNQCDVCNYSSRFSLAICSLRYRPNSGCFKCGSKINVSIKTNQNNEYEKIIFQ